MFTKLFSTFGKNTITLCQSYSGALPSSHELDIKTLNFYEQLGTESPNPACVLFKWFGTQEYDSLRTKYNLDRPSAAALCFKEGIRQSFHNECASLQ